MLLRGALAMAVAGVERIAGVKRIALFFIRRTTMFSSGEQR
jgi:hypothetical protein